MKVALLVCIVGVFVWMFYDLFNKTYEEKGELKSEFEQDDKWYYYKLKLKIFGIFLLLVLILIVVWFAGKVV